MGMSPAQAQTPFASFDRASEAMLSDPHDLAIGPDGRLYVADKFAGRIMIFDPDSLELVGVAMDGQLPGVHDISFGPDGRAYVAVTGASAMAVLEQSGETWGMVDALQPFPRTEGVLAHSNGRSYIMSSATGEIVMMQGRDLLGVLPGFVGAHDLAEAPDGSIWLADTRARRLVRVSQDLDLLQVLSGEAFGFVGPRYMDIDEGGRIVVADQDAHRILLIDPVGEKLLGVIGDGRPGLGVNRFDDPEGVAIKDNAFFFSDSDNNRVVKYVIVTH